MALRITGSGSTATAMFHRQAQNIGNPHPDTDEHRAGCTHCQYLHDSKLPDTVIHQPWGEGRRAFILTEEQAALIADALDIVNPDLAIQFRQVGGDHAR